MQSALVTTKTRSPPPNSLPDWTPFFSSLVEMRPYCSVSHTSPGASPEQ